MAQTYTLEEAADKLNLSIEEFKRRLRTEWTQVRSFRDGPTLRFRANEIEELARSIGLGSSDELPLAEGSDLSIPAEIGLAPEPASKTPPPAKKAAADDAPLKLDDSDEMFLVTPDDPKPKAKSDSDVRLEKPGSKKPAASTEDEESILTDEFEVPVSAGGSGKLSGKSGKLTAAQLKSDSGRLKSGEAKKASDSDKRKATAPTMADDSSSEFELTLEADSDEFELSVTPDSSEEVALGEAPAEAKNKSGQSGINLARPADSGVSLEKKKKKAPVDEEEIDFELSLDVPGSGSSSKKVGGSGKKLEADSDSEFELTLEEPSDLSLPSAKDADKKGDIFEATDFEIPALEDDSASEAVSIDEADTDLESSDFDLALDEGDAAAEDESASEVVAIDDDDVKGAKAKHKKKKKKVVEEEDEGDIDLEDDDDDGSVGEALAGVERDEDEDEAETVAATAGPAKWGALPAILLFPTTIVLFLGALMAYETLHSVWGYQQSSKPTTPLITFFADTFGLKPGP